MNDLSIGNPKSDGVFSSPIVGINKRRGWPEYSPTFVAQIFPLPPISLRII